MKNPDKEQFSGMWEAKSIFDILEQIDQQSKSSFAQLDFEPKPAAATWAVAATAKNSSRALAATG